MSSIRWKCKNKELTIRHIDFHNIIIIMTRSGSRVIILIFLYNMKYILWEICMWKKEREIIIKVEEISTYIFTYTIVQ